MKTYTPRPDWLVLDWHHACITAGTLTIQRCADCNTWRHTPRRFCRNCQSDAFCFEPVSCAGRVLSFAQSHRSQDPGWQAQAPYSTLVVELDEGPRVIAATAIPVGDVSIDQRVRVGIEPRSEDFVLVWAEPD